MKFRLTILLLLLFTFNAEAQQKEFEFRNLTTEEGLPSNESYFIFRDSRNYLWFATDQGVVRYNGSKMEKFNLPDNVVFKIYEDSKGRIWFFSHSGKLAYFYKEAIYPYKYNDRISQKFATIVITNAYVTDDDDLIINESRRNIRISKDGVVTSTSFITRNTLDTASFKIIAIDNRPDRYFMYLTKGVEIATTLSIINLHINDSNVVIRGPGFQTFPQQFSCLSSLDGKSFFLYFERNLIKLNADGTHKAVVLPSVINCIEMDNNNLWVGLTKSGTALMDMNLNMVYGKPILADKTVTSVRKDYEGGLWFSTLEKGVYYLKNSHVKHLTGDIALTRNTFCIFNENDSSLLFGNKDGVFRLSDKQVEPVYRRSHIRIQEIYTDNQRNIFIAGSRESARCFIGEYTSISDRNYKKAFLFHANSEGVIIDYNKYVASSYFGTTYFDVTPLKVNGKSDVCLDFIQRDSNSIPGFIFADSKKAMWKGSIKALYRSPSLMQPLVQFKPGDSLFSKGVSCMRQMHNDIYLIGIRFGGIALMQDTTVIARITEKEGLLSNSIKYMLLQRNQVWAATANGISVISFQSFAPLKYTITNIGRNEGFYNVIINQLMPFGKSIIAATSNGIYEIEQAGSFLNKTTKPIYLYINSLKYYKGDTSGISYITLPYNKNKLVINYSAVCFNLAEEIKYYYRFDDGDTSWHEIASTELLLENLIPGTYDLQIKAGVSGEQRYSEIKKLQITIEKAWWQNNWLKLVVLLLAVGLGYAFLKIRVNRIYKREKQNAALKTRMIELEQTALRSQMNPHFIFNCLTSIQQLIISGNKTDANEYLVKFARLIRKTLDLSARSFITIEEETDYLKEYMVLEQLRIPGQFDFAITIDVNINVHRYEIPGMMLQPIIENSIRHGIKHLENKTGFINISLKAEEGYILCIIADNGVGRGRSGENKGSSFRENKSYGMEIVTRRLSAISFHHESEGTIDVEDLVHEDGSPGGTKVTMRLPFKIK